MVGFNRLFSASTVADNTPDVAIEESESDMNSQRKQSMKKNCNPFNPQCYICHPGQKKVWERILKFLSSPNEKALIVEAPKGGGKSWLLLFLHWLSFHAYEDITNTKISPSCLAQIQNVWQHLSQFLYPKNKALFIGCEQWSPNIRPAAEFFVVPASKILSEEEIRNEVAQKLKKIWDLKGVPLPHTDDEQVTFLYALRAQLNEMPPKNFSLLLVDTPEALSDETRELLETLALAPYLDAPGGKVLLTLRVGALPSWRHWALREAERVRLPAISEVEKFWIQKYEQKSPPILVEIKKRFEQCPEPVRQDVQGLPPLLMDLVKECIKDKVEEEHLWSCLRERWLKHAFRHYIEDTDEMSLSLRSQGEKKKLIFSLKQWGQLLESLITRYHEREKEGTFDAWDWDPAPEMRAQVQTQPPGLFWNRWPIYSFLQHEGLMRYREGKWWFDPSLCLLFSRNLQVHSQLPSMEEE